MFKIINISDVEHDNFVKSHKIGSMCQLTSWANVKKQFWYSKRLAVANENNQVVGVAQILFRKIPYINKTIGYCSRGFICDFTNTELVKFLKDEAIKIAKNENAILLKIDPNQERFDDETIPEKLKELGFKHNGFTVGMSDFQPRFKMVTDISDDLDSLLKTFNPRAKTNIKKATKYDLSFEIVGLDEIDSFYKIMRITEKRDGFLGREKSYYVNLIQEMAKDNDALLVLIKMYPEKTLKVLEKEKLDIEKEREKLEKKLTKLEDDNKKKNLYIQVDENKNRANKVQSLIDNIKSLEDKEIVLSGSILTFCGAKAYYLYGASSNDFRELLSNYFMQWEMMKLSKERGCTSYDFGGISGIMSEDDHEYGLYDFKRRFNSRVHENIGEFDYILKPFWVFMVNQGIDKMKKLRKLFIKNK